MHRTDNLHVVSNKPLRPPSAVTAQVPLTEHAAHLVSTTRECIREILAGRDRRALVIVGPCSIHDPVAALEYGRLLKPIRDRLHDRLEVVMRVYFEKPRTSIGWKGLINDPHLDGSYDINAGLTTARKLLADLAEIGVPAATELLDPVTPQYLADLIAWTAIGARTTESQPHREMASGLSMPVGFKNSTDGSLNAAVNAMLAAGHSHHFLGIDTHGHASIVTTTGNPDCHLVLRGGRQGPNYDHESVAKASIELAAAGVPTRMLIDCSHDNAQKDHSKQIAVCAAVAGQISKGSADILGVMIESNLVAGRQDLAKAQGKLVHGLSITDACVDLATTESMLTPLASAIATGRRATAA
ncbi:MAG: 3-deoxy-7-phosphoheptulonate synthase [Planctomycetota bacterium]